LTVWKYPDYSESKTIKLPCGHYGLFAYHRSSGVYTAAKDFYVAYPTRISISAPDAVAVDYPFTVEGKLEYCDEDTWKPLAGATVYVYYDGSELGSATTDSEGNYSVSGSISTPGTYTLTARYPGEGLPGGYAPAEATREVAVGRPRVPLAAVAAAGIIAAAALAALLGRRR